MAGSSPVTTPAAPVSEADDDREWMIPEDRLGIYDIDPWTGVLDDWSEEGDERFQYPAGMP